MRETGSITGKPLTGAHRLFACFGKKAYATGAEARLALRRMTRRGDWKRGNEGRRLGTYACKFCPKWHIGGQPK